MMGGGGFGGLVAGGMLFGCLMGDGRLYGSSVRGGRLCCCFMGDDGLCGSSFVSGRLWSCLVGGGSLLASLEVGVGEDLGISAAIREKLVLRVWH